MRWSLVVILGLFHSIFHSALRGISGLLCTSLILAPLPATAQINKFPGVDWTPKLFVEVPGYVYRIQSLLNADDEIALQPNTRSLVGFYLNYRDTFGVRLSFRIPEEGEEIRGPTQYEDWRFSFAYDSFHLVLNFMEYRGFYIENSSQLGLSSAGEYYFVPDLKVRNVSANLTYIVSPTQFSLMAALDQTARQEISGGSFLWGLVYSEVLWDHPQFIIPLPLQPRFGEDAELRSGHFRTLSFKGGYGHTFVHENRKWFLSLAGMFGIGVQSRSYQVGAEKFAPWREAYKVDIAISGGYAGERYFSGILAVADDTVFRLNSLSVGSNVYAVQLFVGMRL